MIQLRTASFFTPATSVRTYFRATEETKPESSQKASDSSKADNSPKAPNWLKVMFLELYPRINNAIHGGKSRIATAKAEKIFPEDPKNPTVGKINEKVDAMRLNLDNAMTDGSAKGPEYHTEETDPLNIAEKIISNARKAASLMQKFQNQTRNDSRY